MPGAWRGGWAHPHFVVDQVQHGMVGDPVQGQAGQPLPQCLQKLPDRRPAGQQLGEKGTLVRVCPGNMSPPPRQGDARPPDTDPLGKCVRPAQGSDLELGRGLPRTHGSSQLKGKPKVWAAGSGQRHPLCRPQHHPRHNGR